MATASAPSDLAHPTKRHRRRLRRLEARLGRAQVQEQRRIDRLECARRDGAAGEIRRRTHKLERTRAREVRLAAAIAKLQATPGGAAPIEAYCLRDKAKVAMVDPTPTTMRNGQPALSGTCPRCGGRLVRAVAKASMAAG